MAITKIDSRQVKERSALSTIGSSANDTLDTVLSDINNVIVTQTGTQTVTNKTLDKLITEVTTDSTTTGSNATLQSADITKGIVRLTNASLASVSGIPAGTAGQFITIENQTGATITLNNAAGGSTQILTGTGGNVTMLSNSTLSLVYDGTATSWMINGGTGSGSGSGSGKNYLSGYTASTSSGVPNTGNGNWELGSTSGWSLAHSALSSFIPTSVASAGSAFSSSSGGSAASGNLSLSVISSGQIAGSYSGSLASSAASTAGDLLISSAFFIDTEDQAKVMTLKLYYKVQSGASNMNFSGTSSNTFALWMYDVTNGAWIMPAGVYNFVQNSGCGYLTGTFQTTSNSTEYQLAIVNINATSGAYTFYLDDIFVGPQTAPSGPVMSDYSDYSSHLTINGLGSPTSIVIKGRRIGDSLHILGTMISGSATATTLFFSLNGISIDSTKLSSATTTGLGKAWRGSSGVNGIETSTIGLVPFYDGSITNEIFIAYQAATNIIAKANGSDIFGSGNLFSFEFLFPVAGWSSNTVMSNDTDTRVVAAQVYSSTNISVTASTNVVFPTTKYDTHAAYNASTGNYTAPVSGYYRLSLAGLYNNGVTSTNDRLVVNVNGTLYNTIAELQGATANEIDNGTLTVKVNAGDLIAIYAQSSFTLAAAASFFPMWSIERISGPAVITAQSVIAASYYMSSNTSISTSTPYNFDTKLFDTTGSVTTGSGWKFTSPVTGIYQVEALLQQSSSGTSASFYIYKNGSIYKYFSFQNSTLPYSQATTTVQLNAGDYIDIRPSGSITGGGGSITTSSASTIDIFRLGGVG